MFYKILSAVLIISGLLYEPKQVGGYDNEDSDDSDEVIRRWIEQNDQYRTLYLSDLNLKQLPSNLPPNLLHLDSDRNKLTELKNLPPGLLSLSCQKNRLKKLENLPPTLQTLYCANNEIRQLENLPPNLNELICFNNRLTKLDNLPLNLRTLRCENNQLTKLENLPPNLDELDCTENKLTKLENLPLNLIKLLCSNNQLTKLENLPPNLISLVCSNNKLTKLENLPPNLTELNCNNNKLTQLDNLPETLIMLWCGNNKITKLENLPPKLELIECKENPSLEYIVKPNNFVRIIANSYVKILDNKPKEEKKSKEKKIRKHPPNISKCNNPINIFSQESWDKEDTKDLVYLTFGKRKDCYLVDDLETLIKSSTQVMEWTRNPNARTQEDTTGRGYHPDKSKTERYIALPIAQDWVEVNSLEKIIDSEKRKFTMVSNGKKRLGNTEGTFGVSELHGQSELETWKVK